MPTHIALLRAVNVGGTGKLPMADLRALCEDLGYTRVRTYIQSGNVVFDSRKAAARVQQELEAAVGTRIGKPLRVHLRSVEALEVVANASPFAAEDGAKVLVVFLDEAPDPRAWRDLPTPGGERLAATARELHIHFPDGMGRSKLKVPFADRGTGRNLNTVRALIAMARDSR